MERPLEVVFRNMKPSAELEADVRTRGLPDNLYQRE
jgi:hypothetical protein